MKRKHYIYIIFAALIAVRYASYESVEATPELIQTLDHAEIREEALKELEEWNP